MTKDYIKLTHGNPIYENYFVVNWCFFSICNFSCSYCPKDLHDGKAKGLPIEIVKEFCLNIINSKKDRKVFFEFTGGEMTYYKDFIPLFEFLKANGAETGLISNGSRDLVFWEKHKHLIDHICLSFHPEKGKIDHFFNVVKLLNEATTVHVNIMMLPSQFDILRALADKIATEVEGVSVSMQALFENMNGKIYDYTPEQKAELNSPTLNWATNILHRQKEDKIKKVYRGEMLKVFKDGSNLVAQAPELIANGENNWYGWRCNIGLENLVIDYHGDIKRGWCAVGGVIGNVYDLDFEVPSKPIFCTSNNCHCSLDIMATKELV